MGHLGMKFKPVFSMIVIALSGVGCSTLPTPEQIAEANKKAEAAEPKGEKKTFSYSVDITEQLPQKLAEMVCMERAARRAMRHSKQKEARVLDERLEIVPSAKGPAKVKCSVEARVWQ